MRTLTRATVTVAALCLVVPSLAGCGNDDEQVTVGDAPTLPIGPSGFSEASTQSPETTMWQPFEYVAPDALPPKGGDRQAYRITPDADRIGLLAERLGVEPVMFDESSTADQGPVLRDIGGAWTLWTPDLSGSAVATCSSDGECSDNGDETPVGITAEHAETVARALLDDVRLDLPFTVETTASHGSWQVTFQYELDGDRPRDLADHVYVGEDYEIVGGSGFIGHVDEVATYPTVETSVALERLNGRWVPTFGGGSGTATEAIEVSDVDVEPGPSTTTSTPPEHVTTSTSAPAPAGDVPTVPSAGPATTTTVLPVPSGGSPALPPTTGGPVPEPHRTATITITGVEWMFVAARGWDGSGVYLVPAYSFAGDDGQTHVVMAVSDDVIASQQPEQELPETRLQIPETTLAPTTSIG